MIKIVLIEDNPGDARLIKEMLEEIKQTMPFKLECFDRLSKGLARLAKKNVNVVLLDLGLPDSQGFNTFFEVYGQSKNIPIIVLTGLDDRELADKALREGVQDYLIKGQIDSCLLERSIRYAIDRKSTELILRRTNRALKVLTECNEILIRAKKESTFFHNICKTIINVGGYKMVWIGFVEQDEKKSVHPVAYEGYEDNYLESIEISWADNQRGQGPTGTAIRTGNPSISRNIINDPNFAPWREEAMKRGYASSIAIPLITNGQAFGALNIYAVEPNAFDKDEVKLLTELADDLAYGIISIRNEAKRKQAEEELQKYHEQLEELVEERTKKLKETNKELEAFVYSVSHDLKNPLHTIEGFANILLEDYSTTLDAEGKRFLNIISSNTRRMNQLIRDLLDFSRLGSKQIQLSDLDINELVNSVWKELNLDIKPTTILSIKTLPLAKGDIALMRQVFTNLLSNAIKFTRTKEPPTIEVGFNTEENQNIYYIKDNGIGFDMQEADKLFIPFKRLHPIEEYEGTGIGLAIVERIINKHNGQVWAEGKVNKGATIYFSLPRENVKQIGIRKE